LANGATLNTKPGEKGKILVEIPETLTRVSRKLTLMVNYKPTPAVPDDSGAAKKKDEPLFATVDVTVEPRFTESTRTK
jgi:hypothetical protein